MTHKHIPDMLSDRVRETPSATAFRIRRGATYEDVPWSTIGPRIDALAAGLLSAANLDDGACISIVGSTSMDWVLIDFAALSIGLRTVPIYASLLPPEVGFMHADLSVQLAIVDNAAQLEKLRSLRDGFRFFDTTYAAPTFRGRIIVVDPTGLAAADDWESLHDVETRGAASLATTAAERRRRRDALNRETLATFTYTSGTTGPPKAVMQTHANMLSMLEAVDASALFGAAARDHGLFLFLPLAHSFGRLVELAGPFFGAPLVISSVPTLAADLTLARPGFFPAAPRVYEKMMARILSAIDAARPIQRRLARVALDIGSRVARLKAEGRAVPLALRAQVTLADAIVLKKLRARLGLDRASVLLSGSAPLRVDVHAFFASLGLTLVEAYGLTETCPGLTTNRPDRNRIGSVGLPFRGVTLQIADDGEVLAKGPNITAGYWNRPDATRDAFDAEGWFHTGDLGAMDADGFLTITGRKKELLKTSGGKYIAPVKIEALLKAHPIVQEAIVIGDGRNFCTALFALDPELLAEFAARTGIPADPTHANVHAVLEGLVQNANGQLASFESIKAFRVVPRAFTVDGGELTASLKVKRKFVAEKYMDLITEMYAVSARR